VVGEGGQKEDTMACLIDPSGQRTFTSVWEGSFWPPSADGSMASHASRSEHELSTTDTGVVAAVALGEGHARDLGAEASGNSGKVAASLDVQLLTRSVAGSDGYTW
jgi:hypothetical protein